MCHLQYLIEKNGEYIHMLNNLLVVFVVKKAKSVLED
jgi:hypothetical protein